MSQTTFLSDVLGTEPIPKGKLAYFQARLSNTLHELVLKRFMELENESGFTRADLARRIGRKPEQVTRWLGSPGNWTLETVSDLLTGMGCEITPCVVELGTYQDPQAITYAGAWPLSQRPLRYGVINALNRPVIAMFNRGQTVYVLAVPADQDLKGDPDQLSHEIHGALPWDINAAQLLGTGVQSLENDAIALQPLLSQVTGDSLQNPLPTDNQGQSNLRSGSR